jgi:polyisoprenoid-binding protein YceI
MQERALESSRFPEITFTSQSIDLVGENRWTAVGMLMLHGQARSLNIPVRKVDGRYIGTTTIKQTDFGIHPISAAGGTVKVKNELRIDFSIATK